MLRYLFSLLVFLAGFVFTAVFVGGGNVASILSYVDIKTFFTVGLVPFLFVSVLFGFREMGKAYATVLRKEPDADRISKSRRFFNVFGTAIWIMGMINVLIGTIGMFKNLESRSDIWRYMALTLLSIHYSGILYLIAVLPFMLFLKKKQRTQPAEDDRRII
jgi:hypothetical protein